jgi:hypothetical protein
MPGPEDLMALLQQGSGGGAPGGMPPGMSPPTGPPPGGGGMPPQGGPPGMGPGIAQVLQQLMQDPAAMQGMQKFMQQMSGGAPPGPGVPQGPGGQPEGAGGAPQPSAEDMVSQEIDQKGATWDGTDAPTQNDIERLTSDPSPTNIKSFDEQFGQGAAEKYVEGESGGQDSEGAGDTNDQANPQDASEY